MLMIVCRELKGQCCSAASVSMIQGWRKDDVVMTLLGMMWMPLLLCRLAAVDANVQLHPLISGGLKKVSF
jgi:hypothetical protein